MQRWVLPTCQAMESFSLTPLMLLQPRGGAGGGLGTCQQPQAAELLASYNFVVVGCVLPALIAFWQERHFKSERGRGRAAVAAVARMQQRWPSLLCHVSVRAQQRTCTHCAPFVIAGGFMQDRRARGVPKAGLPWAVISASAWGACTATWLLLRQWHVLMRPALVRWASSVAARHDAGP